MQTAVSLAARPEFDVSTVTCQEHHKGWSPIETYSSHHLVLVRSGRFRRWSDGVETDLDRTTAYLAAPGEEERFAHPAGGDVCTSVTFTPSLWGRLPVGTAVYVDARVDLAHRRLLAATASADADYATIEELLRLVAAAAGITDDASAADRTMALAAREAVLEDAPEAGQLVSLAKTLGVSPYRLSRGFSRHTGVSLTRYRNRVRVGNAMTRLAEGQDNLADLAADLGFSDQAHLTRTIREHVGHTPMALRRLLRDRPAEP